MNAGDAIDLLQARLGGHFNRMRLLTEIKLAQNEILALDGVPLMRNKSTIYLSTVSGQSIYPDLPYRTVERVFVREQADDRILEYGRPVRSRPSSADTVDIGGVQFAEYNIPFECQESLSQGTDLATLYFAEDIDLGTYTDKYRLVVQTWPTALTSESSNLSMPDQWVSSLLYYSVKKKLEESAYGVDIYNDPQFTSMLNKFIGRNARKSSQATITRMPRF